MGTLRRPALSRGCAVLEGLDGLDRLRDFLGELRLGGGCGPEVLEVRTRLPAHREELSRRRVPQDLQNDGLVAPELPFVLLDDRAVQPELALRPPLDVAPRQGADALRALAGGGGRRGRREGGGGRC